MDCKLLAFTLFLGGSLLLVALVSNKGSLSLVGDSIGAFYTVGVAHAWEGDGPGDGCGGCGVGAGSSQGGGTGSGSEGSSATALDQSHSTYGEPIGIDASCNGFCGNDRDSGTSGTSGTPLISCPDGSAPVPQGPPLCSENGGCNQMYYCPAPPPATVETPPTTTTACSAGSATVTLSWDYSWSKSRGAGCGYTAVDGDLIIPYASGPKPDWPTLQMLSCTGSYTYSGLESNRTYSYGFHIHHTNGDNFDPPPAPQQGPYQYGSVTTPSCTTPKTPAPASTLTATCSSVDPNVADISWSPATDATYYQVAAVPNDQTNVVCPAGWGPPYTNPINGSVSCNHRVDSGTWAQLTGLSNGLTYWIWVYSGNAAGLNTSGAPVTTVACTPPKNPPTNFTASSCTPSGSVTLSWNSVPGATAYSPSINMQANRCPSGWSSTSLGGGSYGCQFSTPNTSITFVMPKDVPASAVVYAGNPAGFSGASTAQNVTCSPPPTATLSASPTKVTTGNTTTLTWSSTNATSCVAAGGFSTGNKTSGSANSIPLTTDPALFQVTCTGPGGSATANTSVTVTSPNVTISASPTRVLSGASTQVSWKATDVSSCEITKNGSHWKTLDADAPFTSSSPDTITSQTTYKITCTDASAKAYAATVVVNMGDGGFQEF